VVSIHRVGGNQGAMPMEGSGEGKVNDIAESGRCLIWRAGDFGARSDRRQRGGHGSTRQWCMGDASFDFQEGY
jgi:hypothetical protein